MKILLPAIILLLFSCTYKEADQFIPPPPPDSVSYSDIVPILQTYCFGPGYPNPDNGPTCHYPPGSFGGVPIFFNNCSLLHDEAINGTLYTFVLSPNASMPLLSPPLSAEDTALLGAWIREGAICN